MFRLRSEYRGASSLEHVAEARKYGAWHEQPPPRESGQVLPVKPSLSPDVWASGTRECARQSGHICAGRRHIGARVLHHRQCGKDRVPRSMRASGARRAMRPSYWPAKSLRATDPTRQA